jgi:hypothetical protein
MSNDMDSASSSFEDIVARAETLIARKTDQVKEEMAAFAALLGLKDDTAQSAEYEYSFWVDQARAAGIEADAIEDGPYFDERYWRGFPEPIGARMRCVDAFFEVAAFLRADYATEVGYSSLERASLIDHLLGILRSETPKVAAPPTKYRAWLKREKIKERIEHLQDKIEHLQDKLKLTPVIREPGLQTSARIGSEQTI